MYFESVLIKNFIQKSQKICQEKSGIFFSSICGNPAIILLSLKTCIYQINLLNTFTVKLIILTWILFIQVQTVQVVQPDKQPQAISIDQLQQFISSRGISTNEISQIQITPDGQLQIVKNQQQQNSAAGRNNMQFDLN